MGGWEGGGGGSRELPESPLDLLLQLKKTTVYAKFLCLSICAKFSKSTHIGQ